MSKIIFCAWGITPEQQKLLEGIEKYTLTKLEENNLSYEIDIVDPKLYESSEFNDPVIVFSNHNLDNVTLKHPTVSYAPHLKELTTGKDKVEKKKDVVRIIDEFIEYLMVPKPVESIIEPVVEAVIEQQGIKFGSLFGDILITEQEATHLKKIKDILGGGKMVITKGELKVEVE